MNSLEELASNLGGGGEEEELMHNKLVTSCNPRQNLSKTRFMLPPFSIEITLVWSSSLIQTRNVLSLLCLIGREKKTLVLFSHKPSHWCLIDSFHLAPFLLWMGQGLCDEIVVTRLRIRTTEDFHNFISVTTT